MSGPSTGETGPGAGRGRGGGSQAPAGDGTGAGIGEDSRPTSGRRRRRRVVALSQRDRRRVAQGLEPEDLARADYDSDALTTARGSERGGGAANDARLLADVPPHWQ
ncbi:hypothetical protein [Actinomyces capricornis]|uniref:Transcriptional regulator n=1 Tax=Actinomyces capricornis TaxID=2755559 RepID=A0ABM7U9B2_9ACTO|nr:hypothetical protein [Actinomyces capricornis]BDA63989.1 hypothetical protein MANAM107_08230 [Actinomyces capricornis]